MSSKLPILVWCFLDVTSQLGRLSNRLFLLARPTNNSRVEIVRCSEILGNISHRTFDPVIEERNIATSPLGENKVEEVYSFHEKLEEVKEKALKTKCKELREIIWYFTPS